MSDTCILRSQMPQVDEADLADLIAFLQSEDIIVSSCNINPRLIRGRQKVDRSKIRNMTRNLVLSKPILVSREPLIIDGNHRWFYADYYHIPEIFAWKVNLPFEDALAAVMRFPKTYEYGDGNAHSIRN